MIFDDFLIKTNILDENEVKNGIKYIETHGRTEGKKVYLNLFREINNKNIAKAHRFAPLTGAGVSKVILRNIGYILMAVGAVIAYAVDGHVYAIPFWGGVLIAIILGIHKSAWNKLTLNGKVVNPILTMSKQDYEKKLIMTIKNKQTEQGKGNLT